MIILPIDSSIHKIVLSVLHLAYYFSCTTWDYLTIEVNIAFTTHGELPSTSRKGLTAYMPFRSSTATPLAAAMRDWSIHSNAQDSTWNWWGLSWLLKSRLNVWNISSSSVRSCHRYFLRIWSQLWVAAHLDMIHVRGDKSGMIVSSQTSSVALYLERSLLENVLCC